jgi:hypothetical protein
MADNDYYWALMARERAREAARAQRRRPLGVEAPAASRGPAAVRRIYALADRIGMAAWKAIAPRAAALRKRWPDMRH